MKDVAMPRNLPPNARLTASATFRSLLVPIDLTPTSDRILGRVSLLPLADDARVTLLHVVPDTLSRPEQQDAERDAVQRVAEEARHLRKSLPRKVTVDGLVKLGGAAKQIGASAAKVKAELIVMGRGGGRPLRDGFLGSTAERVIRHSRLPVLVVRLPPRAYYDQPALALDLDQAAHHVIRLMLRVVPPPRPRVVVIHAHSVPYQGMYRSLTQYAADPIATEFQAKASGQLATLLSKELARANVGPEEAPRWKTIVRLGPPRSVVQNAVKRAGTYLLVLGTRSRTLAANLFLGTVAGDILREVKCDVLVVPPPRAVGHKG